MAGGVRQRQFGEPGPAGAGEAPAGRSGVTEAGEDGVDRKEGEYRDVPLPTHTRLSILSYADTYGTVDGYLLRHPRDLSKPYPYHLPHNQWQRIVKQSDDVNVPEGMVIYGLRHFFASNCLSHNLPITDVAEWMGHKSIDVTSEIYRHLMPGSIGRAAKLLGLGLAA
ncbi:site-specific integrase [Kitasatospora sp. NPDC004669]|uniref:site-specific integrase n=1 Tax=Kitasatospora sp. NPDC004669 TaxID=3154555 RepID=UPI0033B84512